MIGALAKDTLILDVDVVVLGSKLCASIIYQANQRLVRLVACTLLVVELLQVFTLSGVLGDFKVLRVGIGKILDTLVRHYRNEGIGAFDVAVLDGAHQALSNLSVVRQATLHVVEGRSLQLKLTLLKGLLRAQSSHVDTEFLRVGFPHISHRRGAVRIAAAVGVTGSISKVTLTAAKVVVL